jgi:tryptophan-rich sensory protein
MSVNHSHKKATSLFWFKPSHRTWPEQALGAALFLLVSLTFEWLSWSLIQLSSETEWPRQIFFSHWAFSAAISLPVWTFYNFLAALAMWNLWRRSSLKILGLELAVFLFQLVLQAGWFLSFFVFRESRLALAILLFLCSSTILAALLYWKKERFSGQALIPPFFWIFYVMGVNMAICISNP